MLNDLAKACVFFKKQVLHMLHSMLRHAKMTRTDFEQFLLWEGVVVLKELIFNSFYFGRCGGRVWWS